MVVEPARIHGSRIVAAARRRPQPAGSFGDLGPGALAISEWTQRGLALPDVSRMRRDRLDRLRGELVRRGYAAVLLTDPCSTRPSGRSRSCERRCGQG